MTHMIGSATRVLHLALSALLGICAVASASQDSLRSLQESVTLSLEKVGRLAKEVRQDRFVGIVSFESALSEASQGEKRVSVSNTAWCYSSRNGEQPKIVFKVDGEFRLVERLNGKAPPLGKIKKDVQNMPDPVTGPGWRPDHPLLDFARASRGSDPKGRQTFIVIGVAETIHILDCTFLGPIGEQEIPYIRPVVKALLAGEGEAPAEEARKFLADSNPAMAMLGLVRLDALRQTTLEDYASALAHVQIPYVEEIFLGANHHVWGQESLREQWPQTLRAVFDKAEPDRRSAILDAVRAYVERDTSDMARNLRKVFPELETPKPAGDNKGM